MAVAWSTLFVIMVYLLFLRPLSNDFSVILKTTLIMGGVGFALTIISLDFLTDWADDVNEQVGAVAIASSFVLIGMNFAIQQTDIPFLPDTVERALRYVFYALGGVMMVGSPDWADFFASLSGLLRGGEDNGGILGVADAALNLVSLGLLGE